MEFQQKPRHRDGIRLSGNVEDDSEFLVRLLERGQADIETVCEQIVALAVSGAQARDCLRRAGVFDAMVEPLHLEDPQGLFKPVLLAAISALCSNYSKRPADDQLYEDWNCQVAAVRIVEHMTEFLESPKAEIASGVAEAIANIVVNNRVNQQVVGTKELFVSLTNLLRNFDTSCLAAAACCIRCLCVQATNSRIAIAGGTVPALAQLLLSFDSNVQSRAADALWNISLPDSNKNAVIKSGAVSHLVIMLSSRDIQCQASALGALRILSTCPQGKNFILRAEGLSAAVSLLSSTDARVQVNALGLISCLVKNSTARQDALRDPKLNLLKTIEEISNSNVETTDQIVLRRSKILLKLLST